MPAIAIAAGGGGDAIAAAMLASAMPDLGIQAIMSYSWDRFMIDPAPGPRSATDFQGLIDRGGVMEIPAGAALHKGQSTLPRLAGCIDKPVLLLDATSGAAGMAELINCAAEVFAAAEVVVVDVGGDILAEGHEDSLRTPLADSLTLAAAARSALPVRVIVAGIGLDGELTDRELRSRLHQLEARRTGALTSRDAAPFTEVWSWHPSEANGLLAAAASGWRGRVETQRAAVIELTDAAPQIFEVDARRLVDTSLAAPLVSTAELGEAEAILRDRRGGRSELDIERRRAAGGSAEVVVPNRETLGIIDEYVRGARDRVDALTVRRVVELVRAIDPPTTDALRALLAHSRALHFRPPLYRCR